MNDLTPLTIKPSTERALLTPHLTRRQFLALAGAASAALATGSCGGGGGGGTPVVGPNIGKGNIAGFVFTKPGAPPVLGYTSAPPTGYTAAGSATVAVSGSGPSTGTKADGSFTLQNAVAGLQTLSVTIGGVTTPFPITVFANSTIQVGDPPTTRAAALATAKLKADSAGIDYSGAHILVSQQPVPAGATVAPVFSMHATAAPDVTVTTSAQWLIYMDLVPIARFGHPVAYIFVDAVTGTATVVNSESWPTVNGYNLYADSMVNAASADLMAAPAKYQPRMAQPALSRPAEPGTAILNRAGLRTRNDIPGCTTGNVHALLIQGDSRSDFAADPAHVKALFGQAPFPTAANVVEVTSYTETDPKQAVLSAFAAICAEVSDCDTLVLYITSHGGAVYGQMSYGILLAEAGSSTANGTQAKTVFISPTEFDFGLSKACQIVVIVDTCHSGSFIDLTTDQLQGLPGKEVVIMTACTTRELSTGIAGLSPTNLLLNGQSLTAPRGGLFTDGLVYAFSQGALADGLYTGLGAAFNTAQAYTLAYHATNITMYKGNIQFTTQQPELWMRTLVDGETCGGGSSTVTVK